ncbi:DMT family transporter [Flexithrix dorotheae]|uniref:DMT family transporter n=1 Tax=Flexithrix dorotheae TaxID=70993 RepID=UPI000367D737|nr:EamA family transporter [Flexithrix dorotheae]
MPTKTGDFFRLHFIILLSSIIPIIAIFISLPAIEIVFYRTLIAFVVLGIYIYIKNFRLALDPENLSKIILSGVLTATYWILLMVSAKISNASVCLIGISTTSVWISFITPLFEKKKISILQIIIGIVAVIGIFIISQSNLKHPVGLFVGVIAGFFGALVTIFNAKLSRGYHHYVITFYQMIGAWVGTLLFIPIYLLYFSEGNLQMFPNFQDILLIIALVIVFSIFIYSQFIKIMKTVSPFMVTLSANLSPIYGIIVALIFLGDSEKMNFLFYLGSSIIIISVIIYPLLQKHFNTQ